MIFHNSSDYFIDDGSLGSSNEKQSNRCFFGLIAQLTNEIDSSLGPSCNDQNNLWFFGFIAQ